MRIDERTRKGIEVLKSLAERYEITAAQLERICKVSTGYGVDHLTSDESHMVSTTLIAKGPEQSRQWAKELTT